MFKFLLVLGLLCGITTEACAMLPVNEATVKAAQLYGVKGKAVTPANLMSKWCIADKKQTNRYGQGETVTIYTPYLATAVDAQLKAKRGQTVTEEAGMAVANQFSGILSVGAILNSSFKVEPKLLRSFITQGKKVVEPYSVNLDNSYFKTIVMDKKAYNSGKKIGTGVSTTKLSEVKKEVEAKSKQAVDKNKKPATMPPATVTSVTAPVAETVPVKVWTMQYFLYFDLAELDYNAPMVLTLSDQTGGVREFPFDLRNMN